MTISTSMGGGCSPAVTSKWAKGTGGPSGDECQNLVAVGGFFDGPTHSLRADGFDASEDGTGRGTPLIPVTVSALTKNAYGDNESQESKLIPVAFSCKDHGVDAGELSPTLRSMGHDGSHANAGGQVAVCFSQNPIGYNGVYGRTQEDNTVEVLRELRKEIGEESFAEWGFGVLDAVRTQEILRLEMLRHGAVKEEKKGKGKLVDGSCQSSEDMSEGSMYALWNAESVRCTSQRLRLSEQRSDQLRAYLSILSQSGTSQGWALHDMWIAAKGIWILQQALHSIQEIWRSTCDKDATTKDVHDLSKSSAIQESMREALHAMEARQIEVIKKVGGAGVMAVRRLTPL